MFGDTVTTRLREDTAILATGSATLAMGLDALLLSIAPIENVEWAADAEALVDLLAKSSPALLLIDTAMLADDDAAAALDLVRQLSPRSLRVLLSDSMTEFRELACDDCPDTVVLKGTEPGQLARTLEYLLREGVVV